MAGPSNKRWTLEELERLTDVELRAVPFKDILPVLEMPKIADLDELRRYVRRQNLLADRHAMPPPKTEEEMERRLKEVDADFGLHF